jgi:hypothetical protein
MTTFPLEKISDASEDFLLQIYPQRLRRFCRHPLAVGILFICFNALILIITTSIFGGFTAGAKVNLTQDWGYIPYVLFAFSTLYYYFRMPARFSGTLTKLCDNGVFASDEIEIGKQVSRLAKYSPLRIVPFVVPVIASVLAIFFFPPNAAKDTYWYDINRVSDISNVVIWMLLWMALFGLVISMAVSGAALNSIFANNKISVHSLHPDKSGGFSPVGNFSFQFTIMALLVGIMVGLVAEQSVERGTFRSLYPVFLLYGLAYLVIVPILFYLPIRGAHKAMVAYRDRLIKQTYARYSVENQSKYDIEDKETLTNISGAVEQMDILKRLAVHESSYPVWPFGFRTRVGVFVNAILPLTFTLAGVVFEKILNH